jgi:hypothetical protein
MRAGLLTVTVAALLAPGAAYGASYKFKVDLSITQDTDWAHTVRHPRSVTESYCGSRDVHYVYSGEGDGLLKAKLRGGRITFRNVAGWMSTEMKVPGTVISNAAYTYAREGVPDEGCEVPPPLDTAKMVGTCTPLVRQPGTARSFFLVQRGKLVLTGGFYRKDKKACADPSLYTGVVGFGGKPRRNDLNKLIPNKRVRSIELSAANDTVFTAKTLSDFGANTASLTGSGKGKASWKVKLTRVK